MAGAELRSRCPASPELDDYPETKTFPLTVFSNLSPAPLPYEWDIQVDIVTIAVSHGPLDATFTGSWREDGSFSGRLAPESRRRRDRQHPLRHSSRVRRREILARQTAERLFDGPGRTLTDASENPSGGNAQPCTPARKQLPPERADRHGADEHGQGQRDRDAPAR